MSQPELNQAQLQVMQLFQKADHAETVTSVAKQLKLELALAKNLLEQLTKLHLLRLTMTGSLQHFTVQPSGLFYVRQHTSTTILAELGETYADAFKEVHESGSFGISAKVVAEKLELERKDVLPVLEKLEEGGWIKRWGQGRFFIPAAERAFTNTERTKGSLEKAHSDSEKVSPTKKPVTASHMENDRLQHLQNALDDLDRKIKHPPRILVQDYELKQQVLHRLAEFFEDSISSVLTDIRTDLHNIHHFNSGVQK